MHPVVAPIAEKRVVASIAVHRIVAVATAHKVVAVAAEEHVVAGPADQRIVADAAQEPCIRQRAVHLIEDDRVVAAVPQHQNAVGVVHRRRAVGDSHLSVVHENIAGAVARDLDLVVVSVAADIQQGGTLVERRGGGQQQTLLEALKPGRGLCGCVWGGVGSCSAGMPDAECGTLHQSFSLPTAGSASTARKPPSPFFLRTLPRASDTAPAS